MKTRGYALTGVWLLGALTYGQQPAAGPPKVGVLIITGPNSHNWKNSTPALRKVLEDTGRFDVRVTRNSAARRPRRWRRTAWRS
jgi:hypothetical protein